MSKHLNLSKDFLIISQKLTKIFGCPKVRFLGLRVSKCHPDTLLAKDLSNQMKGSRYTLLSILFKNTCLSLKIYNFFQYFEF